MRLQGLGGGLRLGRGGRGRGALPGLLLLLLPVVPVEVPGELGGNGRSCRGQRSPRGQGSGGEPVHRTLTSGSMSSASGADEFWGEGPRSRHSTAPTARTQGPMSPGAPSRLTTCQGPCPPPTNRAHGPDGRTAGLLSAPPLHRGARLSPEWAPLAGELGLLPPGQTAAARPLRRTAGTSGPGGAWKAGPPPQGPGRELRAGRGAGGREARGQGAVLPGQPSRPPGGAVRPVWARARRGLTTGDAYRLLAGGADEVTGVGSALGYAVYPDFCLCGRTRKSVPQGARA